MVTIPLEEGCVCAVSRSEAGQQKHLLVLDSKWRQTEEILLDLGPRFHALAGAEPALPQNLRPGDRSAALLMHDRLQLSSQHR